MKTNIAVVGTIGVGKTTFIQNLSTLLESFGSVEIMREPSVSVPQVNKALKNFYKYKTPEWAYTLQVGVSASHQINLQELKYKEYDYLLSDMPYSSFIYGKIHEANNIFSEKDLNDVIAAYRPFYFDYIIHLKASKETTEQRVQQRNNAVKNKEIKKQKDLQITDTSYLENHIQQFEKFFPEYKEKYFKDSILIEKEVPDILNPEYMKMLNEISEQVRK